MKLIRQIISSIANFFIKVACNLPLQRKGIVFADAIFDEKMEIIDNYLLFQEALKDKELSPIYILNSRHARKSELLQKHGDRIFLYEKNDNLFLFRLALLLVRTRFWVDGYFLLIGPLKNIGQIINYSPRVDSINSQHGVNFFKIGAWEKSKKHWGQTFTIM